MTAEKMMYVTDDRDQPDEDLRALVIFQGGNGDWYVQITGINGMGTEGVRISTSGGAATQCPGLGVAISKAYRAMADAAAGVYVPAFNEVAAQLELDAWREAYPHLQYDGIIGLEDKPT